MSLLALSGPAVDGRLYTWITGLAQQAPGWADSLLSAWSAYGLGLFGLLLVVAWWRARAAAEPGKTAMALASPAAVAAAFAVNLGVKSLVHEQRPCRALHAVTLEACPPPGDWSFPSSHSAIAAAAVAALWLVDRRLALAALPAALLMAFSRVWVGAHYPHDAVLGLVCGAVAGSLLTRTARRAGPLVPRLAATRLRPLVAAG